ncbi:MAG: hypothetical protein RL223_4262 [Pseudomonadota bacterium]|jgi:FAD/FMN-containing dehydrogenase
MHAPSNDRQPQAPDGPASDASPAPLIDALRAIVGEAGLLTGADAQPYAQGARYGAGRAACVVRPASTAEVAQVVAVCAAHGARLLPQGANTGLVGASTPDASGRQVLLSLQRLRQRCEIDVLDRCATVDAGLRLSDLDAALQPLGLWFPIDLAADPSIGGMVACNTGGTRLLRHGDVRHNLLALDVVLFDPPGQVLQLGRPLRKDNTGFDLKQLWVGSSGAAGVITGATLELAVRPRQSVTALLVPRDDEAVAALLQAAESALGDVLSAFEGLSGAALQAALDHVPTLRNPFGSAPVPPFSLLIELATGLAPDSGLDLEALLTDFLAPHLDDLLVDAVMGRGQELWQLRHALSDGAKARGRVIGFDISVRRGALMRVRREAAALVAEHFAPLQVLDFGHVGDGGLHFNLVWPHAQLADWDAQRVEAVRQAVYDLVVHTHQGSYSAEHGIGPHNLACYQRYTPPAALALSGRLQALLDPQGLGAGVSYGPA